MKNRAIDMTKGPITKELIVFTLPFIASNLLQVFYSSVDAFWLGRFIGKEAVAAVTVSFPIIFLLSAFFIGFGLAANIMISQYVGGKEYHKLKETAYTSLVFCLIGGILIGVLGFLTGEKLLALMQTDESILPLAGNYLRIYISGVVFVFGYNLIAAFFRGMGDANTPMRLIILGTVANIILDPILIFYFDLGVSGAAFATILAQMIAFCYALYLLYKGDHLLSGSYRGYRFQTEIAKTILKLGIPSSFQQIAVSLTMIFMMSMVNLMGPNVTAAYGIGIMVESYVSIHIMSFNASISTFVGQNIGAGQLERAKEGVNRALLLTTAFTAFFVLCIQLIPGSLLGIFITDPHVITEGVTYLRIGSISYFFFGTMFIYTGAYRGAGATMSTLVLTVLCAWGIRLPLSWLLGIRFDWGPVGLWTGLTVGFALGALISYGYYRYGNWHKKGLTALSQQNIN